MTRLVVVGWALFLGTATISAQVAPFGLPFGTKPLGLQALAPGLVATDVPHVYRAPKVPKPHHLFESYLLVAPPTHGLCKVIATGYEIRNDAYGTGVRNAFTTIKGLLVEKYGPNQEYDLLKTGALWSEPRDWVMSIHQKERTFVAFWGNETKPISDSLGLLWLEVEATSSNSARLSLSYEVPNYSACLADVRKGENAAF